MEKSKEKITIVTHNGSFHADDIFAVATLSLMLEKQGIAESEVEIIRTRDPEIINTADYVVDVGNIYDPVKNRFDHHQKGGAGGRENGIPYAAFGLVWKEFGKEIAGEGDISEIIDKKLVAGIDGPDNSFKITDILYEGIEPYTIYDFFKTYRNLPEKNTEEELYKNFCILVQTAKYILTEEIQRAVYKRQSWTIVEGIYNESVNKNIIVFETYYPWNDFLQSRPDTRLVVYPRMLHDGWNIEVIQDGNFDKARILFPESWAGKRDKELEEITGIPGSVFCHSARWLAATTTREAALALAHLALTAAGK